MRCAPHVRWPERPIACGASAFLIWGLRPQAPYTLARGGPTIPTPLAWLTRSRSFAARSGDVAPGPPTRSLAGAPLIPTPGILSLGASPPDPLHARSRGPAIPTPLAWLTRFRSFALIWNVAPRPPTRSLAGAPRSRSGHS